MTRDIHRSQHEAWKKHSSWRASQQAGITAGGAMTDEQRALTDGVSNLITAVRLNTLVVFQRYAAFDDLF